MRAIARPGSPAPRLPGCPASRLPVPATPRRGDAAPARRVPARAGMDRAREGDDSLDGLVTSADLFYMTESLGRRLRRLHRAPSEDDGMAPGGAEDYGRPPPQAAALEASRPAAPDEGGTGAGGALLLPALRAGGAQQADPLLLALAAAEERLVTGRCCAILLVRSKSRRDKDVSAYLDLGEWRRERSFLALLRGEVDLMPRLSDASVLSFYSFDTNICGGRGASPSFELMTHPTSGLVFRSVLDRKDVRVDPGVADPGDQTRRLEFPKTAYAESAVLFLHTLRRRT